jgi:FMN reductase
VSHSRRIVGIDASPGPAGRTAAAIDAVLAGAANAGAEVQALRLRDLDPVDAISTLRAAGGVVFGSPVYRASMCAELKALLDATPRATEEDRGPLTAKPVAIVMTGASDHHFLALDGVRNVLAGFFACWVVPPGLYAPHAAFGDGVLRDPRVAFAQGAAVSALVDALDRSAALGEVEPQV